METVENIASIAIRYFRMPVAVIQSPEATRLIDGRTDETGALNVCALGRDVLVMVALICQAGLCGRDGLIGTAHGGGPMPLGTIRRVCTPDLTIAELSDSIGSLKKAGFLKADDGTGAITIAVWDAWDCPKIADFREKKEREDEARKKNNESQATYERAWKEADPQTQAHVTAAFQTLWGVYPGYKSNFHNALTMFYYYCADRHHGILDDQNCPATDVCDVADAIVGDMCYLIDTPGSIISRTRANGQKGVMALRNALKNRIWLQANDYSR